MLGKFSAAWRRRALPTRLSDLRFANASYSQFGEDQVIRPLFKRRTNGFYVDVGCFHPIKWSNTYAFYRMGWSGICIDPNPTFQQLWRNWRPRDKFLNLAVTESQEQLFYKSVPGIPQENYLLDGGATNDERESATPIHGMRLDAILQQHHAVGTIDLLSIDCENHDLRVLHSNDFERFRPRAMVVEDHKGLGDTDIHRFCEKRDYRLVGFCSVSRIYLDNRQRKSGALIG